MRDDVQEASAFAEFTELLRDALLHLYDPAHLQEHRLLALIPDDGLGMVSRARLLRQRLLDAIESLRPAGGVSSRSHAWRTHHLLELRYLEANEITEVMEQLGIGKSQYHRDHHHALQCLASVLWHDWQRTRWETDEGISDRAVNASSRVVAERVDPAEILRGVVMLLEPLCRARVVDICVTQDEHLPAIGGDRVALRQVLLALLVATVNATYHGTIHVRARARPGEVEIQVATPLENAPSAFEARIAECRPFFATLGGSISHGSGPENPRGWSVWLRIPSLSRPTVLVVDNNPDFIQLVDRYLAGHGWDVVGAPDVAQASTLARRLQPRVVVLDIVLPEHDGWELLLELKEIPGVKDIPVVVCSVLENADVATSLGAAAYLHKPISQAQLIALLSQFRVGSVGAAQDCQEPRRSCAAAPRARSLPAF